MPRRRRPGAAAGRNNPPPRPGAATTGITPSRGSAGAGGPRGAIPHYWDHLIINLIISEWEKNSKVVQTILFILSFWGNWMSEKGPDMGYLIVVGWVRTGNQVFSQSFPKCNRIWAKTRVNILNFNSFIHGYRIFFKWNMARILNSSFGSYCCLGCV